jgi:hypothetical protein
MAIRAAIASDQVSVRLADTYWRRTHLQVSHAHIRSFGWRGCADRLARRPVPRIGSAEQPPFHAPRDRAECNEFGIVTMQDRLR